MDARNKPKEALQKEVAHDKFLRKKWTCTTSQRKKIYMLVPIQSTPIRDGQLHYDLVIDFEDVT